MCPDTTDTAPKQLELLTAFVPKLSRVGVLVNPINPYTVTVLKGFRAAAQTIGATVIPFEATSVEEIDGAFSSMAKERPDALIITGDRFFFQQRDQIARLALKQHLPTMARDRNLPAAGALTVNCRVEVVPPTSTSEASARTATHR